MNAPQGGRSEQEISLREYYDDRLLRLERAVETEFARIAKQRVEDTTAREVRLREHELAHAQEHLFASRAIEESKGNINQRFEGVNEFRKSLSDLSATMAARQYVDTRFDAVLSKMDQSDKNLTARLDAVDKTLNQSSGRSGGTLQTITFIGMGLSMLATVIAIYFALSGGR